MSNIDLTEAIEAASRTAYEQDRAATTSPSRKRLPEWDKLTDAQRAVYRERLSPVVEAAHLDIASQAWRQCYGLAYTDGEFRTYGQNTNPFSEETR